MMNEPTLDQDPGYEAFYYAQQQQEREEWLQTEDAIDYINAKLMDAAYDDQFEIEVQ